MTETCSCGARFESGGFSGHVAKRLAGFRELHAPCLAAAAERESGLARMSEGRATDAERVAVLKALEEIAFHHYGTRHIEALTPIIGRDRAFALASFLHEKGATDERA